MRARLVRLGLLASVAAAGCATAASGLAASAPACRAAVSSIGPVTIANGIRSPEPQAHVTWYPAGCRR